MPLIPFRFVPAALAASLALVSLPALAGNAGPGAGHGSVSGGVSGFSGGAGHAGAAMGGMAAGHGAQGFSGHGFAGHGASGRGLAAGWSRGGGQGWHGQGWHGQGWHGQGWHGQGWHGQGWHGQGWHGGFGRASGMVSDGNSTQTPYAPPAIYRVEADGAWRRHQARHRGRVQGRPGAGIYAVGGSEPVYSPNVLVVRVPRG